MWYIRNFPIIHYYKLNRFIRFLNSKIPVQPVEINRNSEFCRTKIDRNTIAHLERLSLVDFGNEKGINILEDAVAFADQLKSVNTEGVEPLVTVLEDRELRLRDDIVNDGNCREKILSNASITEEDYFVAPPGNIPVAPKQYPNSVDCDKEIIQKKN